MRALVLAPPLPGAGERVLGPQPQREFWYQAFHQLPLAEQLVDGSRPALRAYLEHFWTHWSGPDHLPDPAELDRLADAYARPGAFTRSINWYRAGAGTVAMALQEKAPAPDDRIAAPTIVLWPEHDPLFPREWSDRVDQWFSDAQVRPIDGVGPARHSATIDAPNVYPGAHWQRVSGLQGAAGAASAPRGGVRAAAVVAGAHPG